MKTTLIWALGAGCVVALFALLWPRAAVNDAERRAVAEGRTVISYWDRHQGHEHEMRLALIDEFNRSQDKIYVRAISVGYNSIMEKLLTAIAGSAPPDVCSLESIMAIQLADQGCLMPLEPFMQADPEFGRDKYFAYAWDSVTADGHVWAVPATTDVYCLLWNKAAFRVAGLDPERPPCTFTELHEYAKRLTIRDGNTLQQVGFIPWQPWDMSGMWSLLFGGRLYDDETGLAVCGRDPALLRMMRWQQSFATGPNPADDPPYAMDPEAIGSFTRGLGAYMSANNPFYSGKVAMMAEGEWQVTFIPKYAPNLDWGVAPLPMPDGEKQRVMGWPCVVDSIPRGAPHPGEAWAFVKWFNTPRPGGLSPASDYCYAIHNVCPRKEDAVQERFVSNPKFKVFVDELFNREVVSLPVMPLTQFYMDEFERLRELVVFRKITPEDALMDLEKKVNGELVKLRRFQGPAS